MTAHPSFEDRRLWNELLAEAIAFGIKARDAAEAETSPPSAERLMKARRRCKGRVLPENQQTADAPLVQLIRQLDGSAPLFGDQAWPLRLLRLAELANLQVNPPRRTRADIDE